MLLLFSDQTSFATGSVRYAYRRATEGDATNRIILPIVILPTIRDREPVITEAVLDTGCPYVVLPPSLVELAGFSKDLAFGRNRLKTARAHEPIPGSIARLAIMLQATKGEDLTIDATVFVPDFEEDWVGIPSFIGQEGFLERIRYAIDLTNDTFYFGSP